MEAYRKTFDDGFIRAWKTDLTREPEAIRASIEKQKKIQDTCIKNTLEMTRDARRRLHHPLTKPFAALANPPDIRAAFEKEQAHYDAAAAELVKLERELAESEALRA